MRYRARRNCRRLGGLTAMAILTCTLTSAATCVAVEPNAEPPQHHGLGEGLWYGSSAPFVDLSQSWRWLRGFSLSGYAQTTSGIWANSSSLTEFGRSSGEHHGANSLAVERSLLQLDANYFLNGNNSWFSAILGCVRTGISLGSS